MATASAIYAGLTLHKARARFCVDNRLLPDGGEGTDWWSIRFGKLAIHLPNFAWRRRALLRHDLHHIVTGYACSPVGEMEMAAWEFSAGRFPSRLATAFCLPLVGLGALLAPKATFAAFLRGRAGTTLYGELLADELLAADVGTLRERLAPANPARPSVGDVAAYYALVLQSLALIATPPLVAVLLAAVARAALNRLGAS